MAKKCIFQIPRGNTSRFVYIFVLKGSYFEVTLKVLMGNAPYKILSKTNVSTNNIYNYINTVVANTY